MEGMHVRLDVKACVYDSSAKKADLHQIIKSGQTLTNEHVQYFTYQVLRGRPPLLDLLINRPFLMFYIR
jgi:hypothetical protein